MKRRALWLASVPAALLLASCASVPLPEREGVALYRAKCSGCHRPYAPSEIKPAAWQATFAEMRKRAKLTAEQADTIRHYIEVDLMAAHDAAAPPVTPAR